MPIPRLKPFRNSKLTRQDWNDIAEFVKRCIMITGGYGIRVTNMPNGVGISLDKGIIQAKDTRIRAKILESELWEPDADPQKNRWTYSWNEVIKTQIGYGPAMLHSGDPWEDSCWMPKADGRAGAYNAFNYVEAMNDGLLTEGNGINVDGTAFPALFTIQPVPRGVIVLLDEIIFSVGDKTYTEYWFSYENAVDGTC